MHFLGRGRGHKGGAKQFTNPERLEERKEKEQKEREWRKKRGEIDSSSDENSQESDEEEESSSSSDEGGDTPKASGANKDKTAEPLIEVNNPNRVAKKAPKKNQLADIETAEVQLSRREREEIEKQKAKEQYARLTAEGKTEQARQDLARLAIIRQQREEAARKKEEERKVKEAAKAQSTQASIAAGKSMASDVTVSGAKSRGKKK